MANLKKVRVYAEQVAKDSGLVEECDVSVFSNGYVAGFKEALQHITAVANRGHITSVLQYCKIDDYE